MSPSLPKSKLPHITIIRPVKGLEPELYACLASTFHQTYPSSKLSIALCVASEDDPAYSVLEQIVEDFSPDFDVRLYVEEYDPLISSLDGNELGPNPKIRNISRAYREAKGELIWITDCNVWLSRGVAGRMVDRLMGFRPDGTTSEPFRFVHQLPLVVDIPPSPAKTDEKGPAASSLASRVLSLGGGRLDEMFMATSHAKFYGAINTVAVAPCIIGKSNMFRKAHLDTYTSPEHNPRLRASDAHRGRGIDFFSRYICEDHLMGDLLWNAPVPSMPRKHGLVWGDVAIQPVRAVPVANYAARRVRWLRARKWTVLLATLVEPGVEAPLCNFCFAYAATTLPWFRDALGIPGTWLATGVLWSLGLAIWMACDRAVFSRLHGCRTVEVDGDTPAFARGTVSLRPFATEWLPAWIGRELLALPIWTWAVLLGTTVSWRGKEFYVNRDMSVKALDNLRGAGGVMAGGEAPAPNGHVEEEDAHPEMGRVPDWEGRPTARHRKSYKT